MTLIWFNYACGSLSVLQYTNCLFNYIATPSSTCSSLPPAMIQFLVKNDPMQPVVQDLPQKQLPSDKCNRSFQTAWFWKQLPGSRNVLRDWLSY
ncbi:hypothetical protein QTP88_020283 [Uroleucon formosanum]